jgi:hypothetical protein
VALEVGELLSMGGRVAMTPRDPRTEGSRNGERLLVSTSCRAMREVTYSALMKRNLQLCPTSKSTHAK